MAVARKITARVVPKTTALDLATVATAIAADAGIDTAVVVTQGQAALADGTVIEKIGTGPAHIFVTTDKENLASTCKTNLDASLAIAGRVSTYAGPTGAISPLLEHNDADNAVTISRAAGATTIRYTATTVEDALDANGLIWTVNQGGISNAAFIAGYFTDISPGVKDLPIDLQAGDSAGPYTVVVTVEYQRLKASADLVVTSTA